ncbi:MAG: ParA family protein [Spirochaetaceae bacterium]|nr:ParA family protein [Spirochaetaceae bacterium]
MSANKIIFLNQKGGVGKTTSVVNLGAALAKLGKRVLLVDFDSQGNLTSSVSADGSLPGMYEVITKQISAVDACQSTSNTNLYIISSNINMAGLNVELVDEDNRNLFVKDVLASIEQTFDFILGDCPPSVGLVTVNALVWAQHVIIPLQCEYLAMEGLNQVMRTVASVRRSLNPSLDFLGILFTMYSKRNKLSYEVVEDVSNYFSDKVFKTIIPRNVRLSEAPSYGLPIFAYDANCSGAKAYMRFAEEVLNRVK